jgi:dipeptidyl-peptidase-4
MPSRCIPSESEEATGNLARPGLGKADREVVRHVTPGLPFRPVDEEVVCPADRRSIERPVMEPAQRRATGGGRRLPFRNGGAVALVGIALAWLASSAVAQPQPRVYRDKVVPHWSADGGRFWYRNDLPGGAREFVLVDAAAGTRELAFDHARVADALAKLTGKAVASGRLPVESLAFGATPSDLVLAADGGAAWRLDLSTYEIQPAAGGKANGDGDGDGDGDAADRPARQLDAPRPSRAGGAESTLTFDNRTDRPADLFWVDPAGDRHAYGPLAPGQRKAQHTFAGHVWLAVDPSRRLTWTFEAGSRPGVATLDRATARKDAGTAAAGGGAATQPNRAPEGDESAADPDAASEVSPDVSPDAASDARSRRRGGGARSSRGPASPDGKWVLSARDDNLFVRAASPAATRPAATQPASTNPAANSPDGGVLPLTSDGKPGDGYALDRVWWSPDGKSLLATRLEAAQEHKVYTVESSPRDQVQPKLRTLDYLKPGDKIEHPRPMLLRVEGRTWVPVSDELFSTPWSIKDVRWSADSSRVTFAYNQRGHQVLRVVAVEAATGRASAVVEETSPTFVDYSGKYFCQWLGDDELLWASERDGWNHLYLYDARAGRVKAQVTRGEWVVQGIDRVDVAKRQVYFRAGGVRPGQDPYYTHVCRANLDGSGFTILTEGDGTHAVQWSPDERYLIGTWSRVDLPPVTELRRGSDGAFVCRLETADAREALAARGGRWPIPLAAKGRDGTTDVYGTVWLPKDFDPAKTYPVLENVYAGPQGFFTPKAFRAGYGERQKLADRGMIVVQADGMGTNGRGKAFHDVCFKNLKDAGFDDRIAWIRAAAAGPVPQMDLARVGIYGGSAGGQNAMAALLWHHDFYTVAVADCGCHDNRMDKIWWNEQWMGWPVDASYAASSNVVHAQLMQGKLMLVVGELDDNVDPSSTFQAAAALQRAGKDFELVVVAGAKHGAAETPYGNRKRGDFLARHLLGNGGK